MALAFNPQSTATHPCRSLPVLECPKHNPCSGLEHSQTDTPALVEACSMSAHPLQLWVAWVASCDGADVLATLFRAHGGRRAGSDPPNQLLCWTCVHEKLNMPEVNDEEERTSTLFQGQHRCSQYMYDTVFCMFSSYHIHSVT